MDDDTTASPRPRDWPERGDEPKRRGKRVCLGTDAPTRGGGGGGGGGTGEQVGAEALYGGQPLNHRHAHRSSGISPSRDRVWARLRVQDSMFGR